MAEMVPSWHSFNHYTCELEQVGDLDRQYWQTITNVIPTGEERLLFNKTVEYYQSHEQEQELRIAMVTIELC